MEPDFNPQSVRLIITLSTPHKYPVVQFDPHITSYYKKLNKFWSNTSHLNDINLITLSGGPKDIVVPTDATYDFSSDLNVAVCKKNFVLFFENFFR